MRTVKFLLNTCINRKRGYCSHGFREGIELQGMTVASENGSPAEKGTHKKHIRKVTKSKERFTQSKAEADTDQLVQRIYVVGLSRQACNTVDPENLKRTKLVNVPRFSGFLVVDELS